MLSNPAWPWYGGHDWSENYYHWLCDVVSDVWFLKLAGYENYPIALRNNQTAPYINQTLEVLGLKRTLCDVNLMDWVLTRHNVVVSPYRHSGAPHRIIIEGYNTLANEVARKDHVLVIVRTHPDGPDRDKSRNIYNIDELEQLLKPLPMRKVIFERLHVKDQIIEAASARAIIGVSGAGLTNFLFASKGAPCVEIRSPLCWQGCFQHICNVLGNKYMLQTGKLLHETTDLYRYGLIVNAKEIADFIKQHTL